MILVLDNEVQPDYRYLAPEIARILPNTDYKVFVDEPTIPDVGSYDGIVLSGSTASVYDDSHANWIEPQIELIQQCIADKVPLLGICFGHQIVNVALGGVVEGKQRRATFVEIEHDNIAVLTGLNSVVPVLHADLVTDPGENMETTAQTKYAAHFCTQHTHAPVWTVQFHPEFTVRVKNRPSDWSTNTYTFEDSNATCVLDNFAKICDDNQNKT